jgi:alpha-tubulin suppressor-like RCC1 family protein
MEMALTLAITAAIASTVLQSTNSANVTSQVECYNSTKVQLNTIKTAVENFAHKNDRLPMPAARDVGVENISYGREAVAASLDTSGGITYGALPFQALNLPTTFAGDCWGNKFTYAVTTALTTNSNNGGYLDPTVNGNITLNSTTSNNINNTTAYAVISHGEDGLGAVKLNFTGPTHGWCTGTMLKHMNCSASSALADAVFNDGADAGVNYFDDIIVASGKPLRTSGPHSYCWGSGVNGNLGNGGISDKLLPFPVNEPPDVSRWKNIVAGRNRTCGIGNDNQAYCWGLFYLGDGTSNLSHVPKSVTLPSGVTGWQAIALGYNDKCAIALEGSLFCWGSDDYGSMGNGPIDTSLKLSPSPVTVPTGVTSWTSVSSGYLTNCAIANTGDAYCWGLNALGPYQSSDIPVIIPKPSGVLKWLKITVGHEHTCAITDTGELNCWGSNRYGNLGNGIISNTTVSAPGISIARPGGVSRWTDVGTFAFRDVYNVFDTHNCAIADTGDAYCWSINDYGELGNGSATSITTTGTTVGVLPYPTLVIKPAGVTSWTAIQPGDLHTCALSNSGTPYCWGQENYGELGDGNASPSQRKTPVAVIIPTGLTFKAASAGLYMTCITY